MSAAPAAPSAASTPQFPSTEARWGRDRQITSRTAWRRNLPNGAGAPIAAANDNEPPIGRAAPAKRELSLEALLEWTYRRQRAHQILRVATDWFLWAADHADLLTNPADRRQVHHDAALVHEAVLALGTEIAALVIEAALFGDWPEWIDETAPRPHPIEPNDRYDDHGWYVREDGTRAEYLKRTAEIVSVPQEEYELAGRKKMRQAKTTTWVKVPVPYAPIQWQPEPEIIEANNRWVVRWQAARPVLVQALRDGQFRDHVLAADAMVAANDNEAPVANDNEPDQAAVAV